VTARFGPVATAMVTPFDDDERLDVDGAAELARWLVANGSDALVLTGTTGESSVLSDEEKLALWGAVRDAVDVPIVVGSGSNDTPHSIELTAQAAEIEVDAVLVVTPYYNRPGPAGIEAHFRVVAESTPLPVVLYDIPIRSGRRIPTDVLVRLAHEVDNIVAVKDATGDPATAARVIADTPDDFELYCGDSALLLPLLAVGAVGVIGVASHWAGPEHRQLVDAFFAGDVERARATNARLLESYAFESGPDWPNPLPVKAMLRTLGLPAGQCRLPMGAAPPDLDERATDVHRRLRHG
jgi:4-hydroxy-tetrahydrodipicolinate synthase